MNNFFPRPYFRFADERGSFAARRRDEGARQADTRTGAPSGSLAAPGAAFLARALIACVAAFSTVPALSQETGDAIIETGPREIFEDGIVPDIAAVDIRSDVNSAVAAHGARDLYLEVFINGATTNLVAHFVAYPDGEIATEDSELGELGLKSLEEARDEDGFIRLSRLPLQAYEIDETAQTIHVETGVEGRATRIVNLAADNLKERMAPASDIGAAVSYTLVASSNDLAQGDKVDVLAGVSAALNGRLFSKLGVIEQSGYVNYTGSEFEKLTRGTTVWSYTDTKRAFVYRAGDIVTGGLEWTRPVYLGGFQVQRNFSLRPDLVTLPIPSFTGTAAVPSSVEIFTQNSRAYSGNVDQGPFEIQNIPVYAGAGEAKVVVKDSLGRETVTRLPYFISSQMLAKGLWDVSLEAGFPRRNSGLESFDYDERAYGVATMRYGLSNRLTLQGHAEFGEDLINGGIGATMPVFSRGAISLAVAGSSSAYGTGALASANLELSWRGWSFMGRVQRTFGDYKDIAAITAEPSTYTLDGVTYTSSPDVSRTVVQAAVSVPLFKKSSSLNFSYTMIESDDGSDSELLGVSTGHQIGRQTSLYASAFMDLKETSRFGVFAGISYRFGDNMTASSELDYDDSGTKLSAEVVKSERTEVGGYGWRVRGSKAGDEILEARGSYRSQYGRLQADIRKNGDQLYAQGQFEGAIAAVGTDVFVAGQINDAFAAVDVGAPGVEVRHQNRPVGKSDWRGKILIPNLVSNERNTISIEPADMPLDAAIPSTRTVVVPASKSGVHVDFGVSEHVHAALVELVDEDGIPLEVGRMGKVSDGEEFIVGYDGQAYVSGLKETNTIIVNTGFEKSCSATFDLPSEAGEQHVIEKLVCRSVQ